MRTAPFTVLVVALAAAAASGAELTLLEAVETGSREHALARLESGAHVDERGPDGTTPLMWAAYHGDLELVQRLVAAGADVSAQNDYGVTALSQAALHGSVPLVEALLEAGADPNAANPEGETPLMLVARAGAVGAARLLLDAGADVNAIEQWGGQSALMWAAAQSQAGMVALLVEHGADVDARGAVRDWQRKVTSEPRPKDMNKGGFTALLYAARESCIECARHLIAGGADPDLADPERVTPLNMALLNLHFDFAAYMIEAGADVDKWDLFGRSPLYMAADLSTLPVKGNGAMAVLPSADVHTGADIVRRLLEAGADPNIRLKRRPPYRDVPQDRGGDTILSVGATPLLRAARACDVEVVRLLLEHGAIVDLPSADGVTPFMAAAGVEHGLRVTRGRERSEQETLATLRLLLDAGADIEARNVADPGFAPSVSSGEQRSNFAYQIRGRQVHGVDAVPHRTAMHGAARKGWNYVIRFLAENGAELEPEDANGRTPLDLAKGQYSGRFLRQDAEPLPETVALLEELIAARATAALP